MENIKPQSAEACILSDQRRSVRKRKDRKPVFSPDDFSPSKRSSFLPFSLSLTSRKKRRLDRRGKIAVSAPDRPHDILSDGKPFSCDLCQSPYVCDSLGSKISKGKRSRHMPSPRQKLNPHTGKLLTLCNACVHSLDGPRQYKKHVEPSPEEKTAYLTEAKAFASGLAAELQDSDAERLYCPSYKRTACKCLQTYISSEGNKELMTERAKQLLALLKNARALSTEKVYSLDEMTKKLAPRKKFKSGKIGLGNGQKRSPRFEAFILEQRSRLKHDFALCEHAAQRVLCYSNNFLHKKLKTEERGRRVKRQKGKAAMGLLKSLEEIGSWSCCIDKCVRMVFSHRNLLQQWRKRAVTSQSEARRVLAEMLTPSGGVRSNCYKFISWVTGCSNSTISKVKDYMRRTKGDREPPEHGLYRYWHHRERGCSKEKVPSATVTCNKQEGATALPRENYSSTSTVAGVSDKDHILTSCPVVSTPDQSVDYRVLCPVSLQDQNADNRTSFPVISDQNVNYRTSCPVNVAGVQGTGLAVQQRHLLGLQQHLLEQHSAISQQQQQLVRQHMLSNDDPHQPNWSGSIPNLPGIQQQLIMQLSQLQMAQQQLSQTIQTLQHQLGIAHSTQLNMCHAMPLQQIGLGYNNQHLSFGQTIPLQQLNHSSTIPLQQLSHSATIPLQQLHQGQTFPQLGLRQPLQQLNFGQILPLPWEQGQNSQPLQQLNLSESLSLNLNRGQAIQPVQQMFGQAFPAQDQSQINLPVDQMSLGQTHVLSHPVEQLSLGQTHLLSEQPNQQHLNDGRGLAHFTQTAPSVHSTRLGQMSQHLSLVQRAHPEQNVQHLKMGPNAQQNSIGQNVPNLQINREQHHTSMLNAQQLCPRQTVPNLLSCSQTISDQPLLLQNISLNAVQPVQQLNVDGLIQQQTTGQNTNHTGQLAPLTIGQQSSQASVVHSTPVTLGQHILPSVLQSVPLPMDQHSVHTNVSQCVSLPMGQHTQQAIVSQSIPHPIGQHSPNVSQSVSVSMGHHTPQIIVSKSIPEPIGQHSSKTYVSQSFSVPIVQHSPKTHVSQSFSVPIGQHSPKTHVSQSFSVPIGQHTSQATVSSSIPVAIGQQSPQTSVVQSTCTVGQQPSQTSALPSTPATVGQHLLPSAVHFSLKTGNIAHLLNLGLLTQQKIVGHAAQLPILAEDTLHDTQGQTNQMMTCENPKLYVTLGQITQPVTCVTMGHFTPSLAEGQHTQLAYQQHPSVERPSALELSTEYSSETCAGVARSLNENLGQKSQRQIPTSGMQKKPDGSNPKYQTLLTSLQHQAVPMLQLQGNTIAHLMQGPLLRHQQNTVFPQEVHQQSESQTFPQVKPVSQAVLQAAQVSHMALDSLKQTSQTLEAGLHSLSSHSKQKAIHFQADMHHHVQKFPPQVVQQEILNQPFKEIPVHTEHAKCQNDSQILLKFSELQTTVKQPEIIVECSKSEIVQQSAIACSQSEIEQQRNHLIEIDRQKLLHLEKSRISESMSDVSIVKLIENNPETNSHNSDCSQQSDSSVLPNDSVEQNLHLTAPQLNSTTDSSLKQTVAKNNHGQNKAHDPYLIKSRRLRNHGKDHIPVTAIEGQKSISIQNQPGNQICGQNLNEADNSLQCQPKKLKVCLLSTQNSAAVDISQKHECALLNNLIKLPSLVPNSTSMTSVSSVHIQPSTSYQIPIPSPLNFQIPVQPQISVQTPVQPKMSVQTPIQPPVSVQIPVSLSNSVQDFGGKNNITLLPPTQIVIVLPQTTARQCQDVLLPVGSVMNQISSVPIQTNSAFLRSAHGALNTQKMVGKTGSSWQIGGLQKMASMQILPKTTEVQYSQKQHLSAGQMLNPVSGELLHNLCPSRQVPEQDSSTCVVFSVPNQTQKKSQAPTDADLGQDFLQYRNISDNHIKSGISMKEKDVSLQLVTSLSKPALSVNLTSGTGSILQPSEQCNISGPSSDRKTSRLEPTLSKHVPPVSPTLARLDCFSKQPSHKAALVHNLSPVCAARCNLPSSTSSSCTIQSVSFPPVELCSDAQPKVKESKLPACQSPIVDSTNVAEPVNSCAPGMYMSSHVPAPCTPVFIRSNCTLTSPVVSQSCSHSCNNITTPNSFSELVQNKELNLISVAGLPVSQSNTSSHLSISRAVLLPSTSMSATFTGNSITNVVSKMSSSIFFTSSASDKHTFPGSAAFDKAFISGSGRKGNIKLRPSVQMPTTSSGTGANSQVIVSPQSSDKVTSVVSTGIITHNHLQLSLMTSNNVMKIKQTCSTSQSFRDKPKSRKVFQTAVMSDTSIIPSALITSTDSTTVVPSSSVGYASPLIMTTAIETPIICSSKSCTSSQPRLAATLPLAGAQSAISSGIKQTSTVSKMVQVSSLPFYKTGVGLPWSLDRSSGPPSCKNLDVVDGASVLSNTCPEEKNGLVDKGTRQNIHCTSDDCHMTAGNVDPQEMLTQNIVSKHLPQTDTSPQRMFISSEKTKNLNCTEIAQTQISFDNAHCSAVTPGVELVCMPPANRVKNMGSFRTDSMFVPMGPLKCILSQASNSNMPDQPISCVSKQEKFTNIFALNNTNSEKRDLPTATLLLPASDILFSHNSPTKADINSRSTITSPVNTSSTFSNRPLTVADISSRGYITLPANVGSTSRDINAMPTKTDIVPSSVPMRLGDLCTTATASKLPSLVLISKPVPLLSDTSNGINAPDINSSSGDCHNLSSSLCDTHPISFTTALDANNQRVCITSPMNLFQLQNLLAQLRMLPGSEIKEVVPPSTLNQNAVPPDTASVINTCMASPALRSGTSTGTASLSVRFGKTTCMAAPAVRSGTTACIAAPAIRSETVTCVASPPVQSEKEEDAIKCLELNYRLQEGFLKGQEFIQQFYLSLPQQNSISLVENPVHCSLSEAEKPSANIQTTSLQAASMCSKVHTADHPVFFTSPQILTCTSTQSGTSTNYIVANSNQKNNTGQSFVSKTAAQTDLNQKSNIGQRSTFKTETQTGSNQNKSGRSPTSKSAPQTDSNQNNKNSVQSRLPKSAPQTDSNQNNRNGVQSHLPKSAPQTDSNQNNRSSVQSHLCKAVPQTSTTGQSGKRASRSRVTKRQYSGAEQEKAVSKLSETNHSTLRVPNTSTVFSLSDSASGLLLPDSNQSQVKVTNCSTTIVRNEFDVNSDCIDQPIADLPGVTETESCPVSSTSSLKTFTSDRPGVFSGSASARVILKDTQLPMLQTQTPAISSPSELVIENSALHQVMLPPQEPHTKLQHLYMSHTPVSDTFMQIQPFSGTQPQSFYHEQMATLQQDQVLLSLSSRGKEVDTDDGSHEADAVWYHLGSSSSRSRNSSGASSIEPSITFDPSSLPFDIMQVIQQGLAMTVAEIVPSGAGEDSSPSS